MRVCHGMSTHVIKSILFKHTTARCAYKLTTLLLDLQIFIMSVGENWTSIQKTWGAQGPEFFVQ